MKSRRRHELQTNELADQIGQWIETVRPHLTMIALIVVGIMAVLAAWYYVASIREDQVAQAWRAYMSAGLNPQGDVGRDLRLVADEFPETPAGLWASLMAADVEAGQAVQQLFQEKATAETNLARAAETYRKVLSSELVQSNPLLEPRAHFGLANTLEALGDLDEAAEHYQAVVLAEKESALAKAAQQRADRLSQAPTRAWYQWFAEKQPSPRKPADDAAFKSGLDAPLGDLKTLPEQPSEDFMKETAKAPGKPAAAGTNAPETAPAAQPAPQLEAPQIEPPAEAATEAGKKDSQ